MYTIFYEEDISCNFSELFDETDCTSIESLDDLFCYWDENSLDRCNIIMNLVNFLDELGFDINSDNSEYIDLIEKLSKGYKYITESEARKIVEITEDNCKNVIILKKLACIFAGENLKNDKNVWLTICDKHSYSFYEDENVFIGWFFRLSENKEYYNWMKKGFLKRKIDVIARIMYIPLMIKMFVECAYLELPKMIMFLKAPNMMFLLCIPAIVDFILTVLLATSIFYRLNAKMLIVFKPHFKHLRV